MPTAIDRRFDGSNARCYVYTYKDGVLSKMGHDLKLAVTRFSLTISTAPRVVEATFDAGSLAVVGVQVDGRDAPTSLTASDRREIETHIIETLAVKRYPEISFRSTLVGPTGPATFRIEGRLRLHGVEQEIALTAHSLGGETTVETRLNQPDFKIPPYRALFGALRVKADVLVRVVLPMTP